MKNSPPPKDLSSSIQAILENELNSPVLTWKSKKVAGALVTKIGQLRYLGILKKDKKGQEYWRYHLLTKTTDSTNAEKTSSENSVSAQQIEGDQRTAEISFSTEKELEESPAVKKFREKYGNPNQAQKPTGEH